MRSTSPNFARCRSNTELSHRRVRSIVPICRSLNGTDRKNGFDFEIERSLANVKPFSIRLISCFEFQLDPSASWVIRVRSIALLPKPKLDRPEEGNGTTRFPHAKSYSVRKISCFGNPLSPRHDSTCFALRSKTYNQRITAAFQPLYV